MQKSDKNTWCYRTRKKTEKKEVFVQEGEHLQLPECSALYQTNEVSCWWVMSCEHVLLILKTLEVGNRQLGLMILVYI